MREFVKNIISSLEKQPEIWTLGETKAYVQREKLGMTVADYAIYLCWSFYWLDMYVYHPFFVRFTWKEKRAIWKALNKARIVRANNLSIKKQADDKPASQGTGGSDSAS